MCSGPDGAFAPFGRWRCFHGRDEETTVCLPEAQRDGPLRGRLAHIAAYIASGQETGATKRDLMRLSIREAIAIGLAVEDSIQSGDELEDIT